MPTADPDPVEHLDGEAGVPHEVTNLSEEEPVVAVVTRSDPSEWDHITPYERPSR